MIKSMSFLCLLFVSSFCYTSESKSVAKYNPTAMAGRLENVDLNKVSIKALRRQLCNSNQKQQEHQQVINLNKAKIHCLDEKIKDLKVTLGEMNDTWIAAYKVNKKDISVPTAPKYLNEIEDSRCPIMENIDKAIASKALLQGELDVLQSHKVELDDLYQELDSSLKQQATDKITSVISAFMIEKKKNSLQVIEERRKSNAETIAMQKEENLTRRYIANEQQQALQLLAKEQADQKLQVERERKEQQRQKNIEDKAEKAAHTLKIAQEKKEQQEQQKLNQKMLCEQRKSRELAQKKLAQIKDEETTKFLDEASFESIAAGMKIMQDGVDQNVLDREYVKFCEECKINKQGSQFFRKQLNNNKKLTSAKRKELMEDFEVSCEAMNNINSLLEMYEKFIYKKLFTRSDMEAFRHVTMGLLECVSSLMLENRKISWYLSQCPELNQKIIKRYKELDENVIMTSGEAKARQLALRESIQPCLANIEKLELALEEAKKNKNQDKMRELYSALIDSKKELASAKELNLEYQQTCCQAIAGESMQSLRPFLT